MARDDISQLLRDLRDRPTEAIRDLLPLVYDELHAMAHRRLSFRQRDAVLDTTALVHEAYLKLFDRSQLDWRDRKHFFSVAAIAMRQIVVDEARRRTAQKRGGDRRRVELDSTHLAMAEQAEDIVSLNDALLRLSRLDERLTRIVELRFFGGLSVEEVAEVLEVSDRTVKRDWRKARALLYQAMVGDEQP